MPIYEYRCEQCGIFEEMQRITDPPLERCPKCRRKVQRLISSTSFQLKGSGWYVTDYARAGSGNGRDKKKATPEAAGSSDGSDSGAESKGTTSTDSGGTPAKTSS
ncbi:MAG: zinc ribbon domain-containing protein [Deltaproteobacteria bacterium]|nr:MAG: zinc ribbon domain-containing protein [Deltaproteobacteria bacterium]